MRDITKRFGSVVANDRVWLDIYRGEVLALLGENGSGKTTLMNMLSGIYFPDEGQILIDGEEVVIRSPRDAYRYGIGMIHQHFKLVDVFTAAENITLGLEEKLDLKATAARIRSICERYGFDLDPDQKIYDMSVSQKQTVEIVKVLYRGADTLILDEPTAVLTPQETEKLFAVLRSMRADGKAIVIITHKMHEVEALSDRVAVLRHGQFVGDMLTKDTDAQEMTNMMVGHAVTLNIDRPDPSTPSRASRSRTSPCAASTASSSSTTCPSPPTPARSSASRASPAAARRSCSRPSPVCSRRRAAASATSRTTARARSCSARTRCASPRWAWRSPFVPEDRLGMGLVGNMDLADNMMLRSFRKGHGILTDRKAPRKLAETVVEELDVNTPGVTTPVRRLSGGNVQKVLVGREIASAPTVLLTAYAVRGLDINASYTIYDLINRQKERGVAVIYVGEDLDVLLELADRILVLCGGKVSGIVPGRGATKRDVGMMMTQLGGKAHA